MQSNYYFRTRGAVSIEVSAWESLSEWVCRRRHRDTVRLVEGVMSRVMHPSAVPFEFRVLEAMLEATTVYFEKRAKRVRVLLESVTSEINAQHHIDANVSEFQR